MLESKEKEENKMSGTRSEADKKLLVVTQELSELLISHQYDQLWEKAGELNSLLKNVKN